ncbi:MAG: hypothetical protein GKR87_12915 [Kiritimatiellae bacterium]|nr:hypothetical protein [Kiritimatiellia bacterium]
MEASSKTTTYDIFDMSEGAIGMETGDFNGDGYPDIVVTHIGGYSSLSAKAKNLKVLMDGKARALPNMVKLGNAPTNYEPGKTFLYVHGGAIPGENPHWVKIRLLDPTTKNYFGVGAKVVINEKIMRRIMIGGSSFSAYSGDLLVGLGDEPLRSIKIYWPSGNNSEDDYELKQPLSRQVVCIERNKGIVDCK